MLYIIIGAIILLVLGKKKATSTELNKIHLVTNIKSGNIPTITPAKPTSLLSVGGA